MKKVLFIGRSGSGKSTAASKLVSSNSLPTYVLNSSSGGSQKEEERKFFPVEWSEVSELRSANVIAEDLIACDASQLATLQHLCNYACRHQNLPILVMVCHTATSNNIFPILQCVTHVSFMCGRASAKSLRTVLSQFNYKKEERDKMVEDFVADRGVGGAYGYWTLDVEGESFQRDPAGDAPEVKLDSLATYRKTAVNYLGLFCPEREKALAIFDYIVRKLPLQELRSSDLTMDLRDRESGRIKSHSLIDLIHAVTSEDVVPTPDVLRLQAHLSKYVVVPSCFFANEALRRRSGHLASNVKGKK